MNTSHSAPLTTYYRLGLALAAFTALFLLFGIGALGIIGAGGEPDRMFLAVLGVLLVGSAVARLRPAAMSVVLVATAAAQVLVTGIALVAGMADNDGASVGEILMINGMYVVLWLASAELFRRSTETPVTARVGAAAD